MHFFKFPYFLFLGILLFFIIFGSAADDKEDISDDRNLVSNAKNIDFTDGNKYMDADIYLSGDIDEFLEDIEISQRRFRGSPRQFRRRRPFGRRRRSFGRRRRQFGRRRRPFGRRRMLFGRRPYWYGGFDRGWYVHKRIDYEVVSKFTGVGNDSKVNKSVFGIN
ncbi:897_t:CDS:2, partial [Scutellospora calospora]